MTESVEEEQVRVCVCLDEHHDAGGDDCKKARDVHHEYAVEDDVARAREGLR
jgi:hypothetical protein